MRAVEAFHSSFRRGRPYRLPDGSWHGVSTDAPWPTIVRTIPRRGVPGLPMLLGQRMREGRSIGAASLERTARHAYIALD